MPRSYCKGSGRGRYTDRSQRVEAKRQRRTLRQRMRTLDQEVARIEGLAKLMERGIKNATKKPEVENEPTQQAA